MRVMRLVLLLFALVAGGAAHAAPPSPALTGRAADLVAFLNGARPAADLFAPAFLAEIPEARMQAIAGQLRESYGAARSVGGIEAAGDYAGIVRIAFEKLTLRMNLVLDPAAPHLVAGLLVLGPDAPGPSSVPAAVAELKALPGEVSLAAATLGPGPPQTFLAERGDAPMAVGSAFKLWILAELVREVKAGERQWSDVVPLGPPSLPFSTLRTWSPGSPITLHSLAALMISQSDNTAADTLLALIGREKVERLLPALGVQAAGRDRPLLQTREVAILKADPKLRQAWAQADEAQRRALLRREVAARDPSRIDLSVFEAAPIAVHEIEWFASAADLVRTLDWLRRNGDATALAILAINPGLPGATGGFAYAGYKGGSETGVLNLSFLLRRRDGSWLAVVATWNNAEAKLDETRFALAISQLLRLLQDGMTPPPK